MTERHGLLPEHCLAVDALVALVDGELPPGAHDRAMSHLAGCVRCARQASAQRQARAALRSAAAPAMPAGLLESLRAIPHSAPLPTGPDELAVTAEGQVVVAQPGSRGEPGSRFGGVPPLGSSAPFGSSTPLGRGDTVLGGGTLNATPPGPQAPRRARAPRNGRRLRNGAGVVVSGLMLGAVMLATPSGAPSGQVPEQAGARDGREPVSQPAGAAGGRPPAPLATTVTTTEDASVVTGRSSPPSAGSGAPSAHLTPSAHDRSTPAGAHGSTTPAPVGP
ncbi:zf-HC2 domain-containing protein [Actinoalloteichus spitiensis]|uniref:zf-HC2 domain-containing protein n=1 Tax=Actinoalloteichus spitiensis TaxID=252394 RepID=UPI0003798D88|nr:zf-HC2 domain-containing protein [Actinoalloteichus spitiensis]